MWLESIFPCVIDHVDLQLVETCSVFRRQRYECPQETIVGGVKEPVIVMCNVPGRIKLVCYSGESIL